MTLEDGHWEIWREAPGFKQRFTGDFQDDGRTISGVGGFGGRLDVGVRLRREL